ncbi:phosphatidylethanolamine-binding protein 4 [Myripristis murdjan]|uniref:Phosphatidylethanolamine binding protein 4 n=1 Tax=Myripristis murdjan TaxID=586833 RepID=A0A668AYM8_9TELE|nr:phosphatidylethanolamine-binding protein 4 [Myripristis murdjan]
MAVAGLLWLLAAVACVLGLQHAEGAADMPALSAADASFCHGGLEVAYPEVDINKCLVISKNLREKISKEWEAPQIYFSGANQRKNYVLMMVDPDAPSRSNPAAANWRHWLVVDIQGSGLRRGQLQGTTLSEYKRPTPPQKSGFHRYQFMLFEQPPDTRLSLTKQEKSSLGKWDPQAFVERLDLGAPVATLQFLTQNHKD